MLNIKVISQNYKKARIARLADRWSLSCIPCPIILGIKLKKKKDTVQ